MTTPTKRITHQEELDLAANNLCLYEMKYEELSTSQKDRLAEVRKMSENEFTTYTIESFKVEAVKDSFEHFSWLK